MGLFKNMKQGIEAAMNPPTQAEIEESLKYLTPEQRAAYDANMAKVEEGQAEAQASWEHAAAISDEARVLEGPAGTKVHGRSMRDGPTPEDIEARVAAGEQNELVAESMTASMDEFKNTFRSVLPGGGAPKQAKDPEERAQIMADEQGVRDEARAPYRADDPPPVTITRISTTGGTQVEEVTDWLGAQGLTVCPEQVYGVYRVPDRISQNLTPHSEKKRPVEWDVVHEPGAGGGGGAGPEFVTFPAREQWVARRRDEPSVLDEDLAVEYLTRAGIGPEQTIGVARYCDFAEPRWGDEDAGILTSVEAVLAFHAPGLGEGVADRMREEAPMSAPPVEGVRTDALNWEAVAAAVQPEIQKGPLAPSPFPYLPATPQELLESYLDIVGIRAEDCFGAAVVVRGDRMLQGGHGNLGPKHPCADGKPRRRYHGAELIVVTYRDQPAYAEGRARWSNYQNEVLQADLHKGTGLRPPVWVDDDSDIDSGILRAGMKVLRVADRVASIGEGKPPPPHRYCWPPIE